MRPACLLAIVTGVCLAFVVGREGSVPWVVVRVLGVGALTLGTVWMLSRGSPRGRAATEVGFGLVAVSIGGGIAGPAVVEIGWTLEAAAGVVAALAGTGFVVGGTLGLVRSWHGWRRVVAFVGVCLVVYVSISVVAAAVTITNVPRVELGAETPGDRGLPYERVQFHAADGVPLSGWFVPPPARDTVVVLTDANTTRSSALDHAEVLAELGYGVLLFDPRGQGRSGGRAMALAWDGDHDALGAVRYVTGRPEAAGGRLFLLGLGAGGAVAISAGAFPDVCGAVAEGVTGRVVADRRWLADAAGVRGWLRMRVEGLRFAMTDLLTSASPPAPMRVALVASAPRRVLVVATLREADEAEVARYLHDGAGEQVDTWIVPGAASGGAVHARRAEWVQRVGDFLGSASC